MLSASKEGLGFRIRSASNSRLIIFVNDFMQLVPFFNLAVNPNRFSKLRDIGSPKSRKHYFVPLPVPSANTTPQGSFNRN